MNKKLLVSSLAFLLMTPVAAFAVPGIYSGNLTGVASSITAIVESIIWSIAVTFVIVMFVIAGFKFLTAQGNSTQVAEARQAVIWGLVGAAVIVLAWSIVTIARNQFGV